MADMQLGRMCEQWELMLPDFRASFHAERPNWERGRLEHCAERMKPGMTVYDVGAECGDMSALYRSWVGVDGAVVPVEPKVEMWPCIQATWSANFSGPPAASFVGFASNITKPVPGQNLFRWSDHAWPAEATGLVQADPGFHHLAQEGDYIQQARLDELAEITGLVPDVIVTDIEGAEYSALRGLARLVIDGVRPLLYISVHPPPMASWYGVSVLDLHDLVEGQYGYSHFEQLPNLGGEGELFYHWAP